MLPNRWFLTALACAVALIAGATKTSAQSMGEDPGKLERMLVEFNERILVEYVLHNNTDPLEAAGRADFFLIGPAGIESRDQVVATVGNLDVDSVRVENTEIRLYGSPAASSAVLAGTLRAEGRLGGRPMPTLSYLSVYVREENKWRLAARSLTPVVFGPPER